MFLFGFLWIITHHSRNKSHHPSGHITSALFSSDIYYPWTFLTVHHHLHCTIHASHAQIAVECKASISHHIRNTSSQIPNWHLQLPMQTLSIHVSTITLLLSCQSLSLKPQTPSASTICFALYMQLAVEWDCNLFLSIPSILSLSWFRPCEPVSLHLLLYLFSSSHMPCTVSTPWNKYLNHN